MSIFKDSLKTIILSALILLLAGIAYAWTEPSQSPPLSNLSAPITISSDGQTKSGNLVVNSLATANGLIVQSGDLNVTNGNAKATAFLYSSDIKLKQNIQPLSNQLEKVLNLQGVSFNWKADNKNDVGFIAQDVEEIFPEVVFTNKETGLKSVDYAKLTVFLVEAIKEQQKEIEELKNYSVFNEKIF